MMLNNNLTSYFVFLQASQQDWMPYLELTTRLF